jgi:hypothetical protein
MTPMSQMHQARYVQVVGADQQHVVSHEITQPLSDCQPFCIHDNARWHITHVQH